MIDYGLGIRLNIIDDDQNFETLREWRNDYRIYRFCRQNDLISGNDHVRWHIKQDEDPSIKMYSILNVNRQVIGVCGLTSIDLVNRNAEFSLYIAPSFQRKGYGKKALKTLVSHGFNTYGLQVIWGESFEYNPAAEMYLQVGFKLDGVRRDFYFREGKFINAHLYSILFRDWFDSEVYKDCKVQTYSS